jgi:hypothetical protein
MKVDANKEEHIALAARLGIALSTQHYSYKYERHWKVLHTMWHILSQRKNLKQSHFQELESLLATWFKQARDSNAVISGILLRAKALQIATTLDIRFKQWHTVVYNTVLGEYKV